MYRITVSYCVLVFVCKLGCNRERAELPACHWALPSHGKDPQLADETQTAADIEDEKLLELKEKPQIDQERFQIWMKLYKVQIMEARIRVGDGAAVHENHAFRDALDDLPQSVAKRWKTSRRCMVAWSFDRMSLHLIKVMMTTPDTPQGLGSHNSTLAHRPRPHTQT